MSKISKTPPPLPQQPPTTIGKPGQAHKPGGITAPTPRQPINPGVIGNGPPGGAVALYAVVAPGNKPPVTVKPLYGAPLKPEPPPLRLLYGAPMPRPSEPGIKPLYGVPVMPGPGNNKPPIHLLYGVRLPQNNLPRLPDFPGSLLPWVGKQGTGRVDRMFQGTTQKLPQDHPGQRAIQLLRQLVSDLRSVYAGR